MITEVDDSEVFFCEMIDYILAHPREVVCANSRSDLSIWYD